MTTATRSAATTGSVLAAAAGAFGSLDSALNIAFPDLVADFDLTVGQLQWVVICFVAASGGLLVPAGMLGDRVGHANLVVVGSVVSVAAMVACASAPGFGLFLVARAVQGVGTATIMASAPALATLASPSEGRNRAIGAFQSASAMGLASGPIIGGLMVLLLGWRGVFWFRVPLAVVLLLLALQANRAALPDRAATVATASGGSVVGSRLAALAQRPVVVASVLTFVANGSMFATWLLVPTLLVDEMGISVIAGGAVLAASPAASAVAARLSPRLTARAGPTTGAVLGLVTMVIGMALVASADKAWPLPPVVAALVLIGCGLGFFSVPNMAAVMAAVGTDNQGLGGGVNLMMRTGGIVVGAAWHSRLFDRVELESGFESAFFAVFVVGALWLLGAVLVAAVEGLMVARRTDA